LIFARQAPPIGDMNIHIDINININSDTGGKIAYAPASKGAKPWNL
jgi:hypothetical protein